MRQIVTDMDSESAEEGWDAGLLMAHIAKYRYLLSAITAVIGVAVALVAVRMPDQYVSEATLMPVQASSSGALASLAGQFGGLASLAGIDLNTGSADKTMLALETINSRQFISYVVNKHSLKVPLFAGLEQVSDGPEWRLDPDIYNSAQKKWVREVNPPFMPEPSDWEVSKKIREEVLSTKYDKKSNVVRVSIKLRSAVATKQWLDIFVEELNSWMRERTVEEKRQSIKYLTEQAVGTDITEMQKVFYSIIEKEQTGLMLAQTQREYAFRIVDPGVIPPISSGPNRMVLMMLGVVGGLMLAALVSVIVECGRRIMSKINKPFK